MSPPSFTPGPWAAWRPTNEAECWSICDNDHSRSLATVWPEALIEGALPVEANARLIAAAPKMFDVLAWIAERTDDEIIRNMANAALAKAVQQ
jgi:hypothetical protein